jgi:ribosomal protein S18 acetylase RimI-like enzyme
MEVREARPEEYAEAGQVTADAYREFIRPEDSGDWHAYLERIADVAERAGRTTIVIAVEDGRVLGSGTLELDGRTEPDEDDPVPPDEAHIRMLGVDPSARGRGVAKAIMAECVRLAREAGRTRMTLNTTKRMRAARRMYESLGFERETDEVFPDGFVLLSYAKRIDG